jgi:hypothetical protein
MIVFGCAVGEAEPYTRHAEPGIRRAAERDSEVLVFARVDPVSRTYNLLLDAAARSDSLEALVLVQPHTELADTQLCEKIRRCLADPEVAVVGCAGASGVSSLAWWEGSVSCGPVTHRYRELGGGEMAAFAWADPRPAPSEVDVVEEALLVLSPRAVRNLRFDESPELGHGFEADFCLQARELGKKVLTAPVQVTLHRSLEILSDRQLWFHSHVALAWKWERRFPAPEGAPAGAAADQASSGSWKERARRAEAELEAARALAFSQQLGYEARVGEAQRRLNEVIDTPSWRLTAPLRELNMARRERKARTCR